MRYRVEHSKINLTSPRAHVLFSISSRLLHGSGCRAQTVSVSVKCRPRKIHRSNNLLNTEYVTCVELCTTQAVRPVQPPYQPKNSVGKNGHVFPNQMRVHKPPPPPPPPPPYSLKIVIRNRKSSIPFSLINMPLIVLCG